jgi:hypothetical protein
MPINVPPFRIDLIDESNRIEQGSTWIRPMTYFSCPNPGQFIGQVYDIPSVGIYSVDLVGGQKIVNITPADSTVYARGDFVVCEKILGQWSLLSAAVLEDLTDVTRIHMQIRDRQNGRVVADLDSANAANGSLGWIETVTTGPNEVSFYMGIPFALTAAIPAFDYKYDVFFFYSDATRYKRQLGDIRVSASITQEVA